MENGNKRPLFHVFPKQLTTRHKIEEYLSMTWSMPHFSQSGFVICPLFTTIDTFVCMTISIPAHHINIVTDAN